MKSSLSMGVRLGLMTALLGAVVSLTGFGSAAEERFGLPLLFRLRGEQPAPAEVVVVALDEPSADLLDLPRDTRKWPRALHARLVEKLHQAGAEIIVFDIAFKDQTPDDAELAEAIRKAGNVLLVESVEQEIFSVGGRTEKTPGRMALMRRVPPIDLLAQAGVAFAPFTLPRVPGQVTRFWTFKDPLGGAATLPVVALQLYASSASKELTDLLNRARRQPRFAALGENFGDVLDRSNQVHSLIRGLREIFQAHPSLSRWMLDEIQRLPEADLKSQPLLTALIRIYSEGTSRQLNFYGPPRTITTLPFSKVLSQTAPLSLDQKVVFIGASTLGAVQQKDGYYTVFSDERGIYLSGVEILATAFANLLEDRSVRSLSLPSQLLLILVWGFAVGFLSIRFSSRTAAVWIGLMVFGYLGLAYARFSIAGVWYPLVVPIVFQTFAAGAGAVAWSSLRARRERQNIRTAVGFYLPGHLVDRMSNHLEGIRSTGESLYGSCLISDVADYTSLAETIPPETLRGLMNDYFDTLFTQIDRFGGAVIDLRGDGIHAVWAEAEPNPALKARACAAALNMTAAFREVNAHRASLALQTRIGLHFGPIFLGNIGGQHHLEYRAVGDTVNTASRIESLNKHLGTEILVSGELLADNPDFITRPLGTFLLAGKSIPLEIYELLGRRDEVEADRLKVCADFSRGVGLYRERRWREAKEIFLRILRDRKEDGPSLFYLQLCNQRIARPPAEPWQPVICPDKKEAGSIPSVQASNRNSI